jgi:hypothetical protein
MAAKNWPVIIVADLNIMVRHIDCLRCYDADTQRFDRIDDPDYENSD